MEIITATNFEEKISKGYSLVDFSATWCGPCKMLIPILEKISKDVKNLPFYKVDVDSDKDLAIKFNIASIPTVILFKDGVKINSFTGFLSEPQIRSFIKENAI